MKSWIDAGDAAFAVAAAAVVAVGAVDKSSSGFKHDDLESYLLVRSYQLGAPHCALARSHVEIEFETGLMVSSHIHTNIHKALFEICLIFAWKS